LTSHIDYADWKKAYAPILKTFSTKNIFVLYSGGKDSSAMLHLLDRAAREFGFAFQAHIGVFPQHRYPKPERERLQTYWQARDVGLTWHAVTATDAALRLEKNPCHKCQRIRKNLLQNSLFKMVPQWDNVVLVISYSLWDLVSYALEHIAGDRLAVTQTDQGVTQRFLETAQRFYPLLEMKEGYQVFRPLIRYNEPDIESLVAAENLPTLAIACTYKDCRPKRMLGRYYAAAGLRFDYDRVMTFARKALDLPDASAFTALSKQDYLGRFF
jgi:tRNA(Ile)-lysidine synthase TilS/MesJ